MCHQIVIVTDTSGATKQHVPLAVAGASTNHINEAIKTIEETAVSGKTAIRLPRMCNLTRVKSILILCYHAGNVKKFKITL